MLQDYKILLASKSPRRQMLLKESGFDLEIVNIECDEDFDDKLKQYEIPVFLSKKKNDAYRKILKENEMLVTADTIVWVNNQVFNKPETEQESYDMIRTLANHHHTVYTGVTLRTADFSHTFYDETEVFFYDLTDEEIWFYIKNFKPFDKAGSYGIQDWIGYRALQKIEGCFYNVMGFPIAKFTHELKKLNK